MRPIESCGGGRAWALGFAIGEDRVVKGEGLSRMACLFAFSGDLRPSNQEWSFSLPLHLQKFDFFLVLRRWILLLRFEGAKKGKAKRVSSKQDQGE